ncbi:hypothetical protein PVAP13_3NG227541 [Panicum virgatum]|uniref:Uncharacterized protein n=1 Tax=Panicum virgatum TaxID=38727 RepID=A0A8T0UJI5_PANVG|nr:hypothetical protein PVAP13_3NG227541 [Panicum virgatum]
MRIWLPPVAEVPTPIPVRIWLGRRRSRLPFPVRIRQGWRRIRLSFPIRTHLGQRSRRPWVLVPRADPGGVGCLRGGQVQGLPRRPSVRPARVFLGGLTFSSSVVPWHPYMWRWKMPCSHKQAPPAMISPGNCAHPLQITSSCAPNRSGPLISPPYNPHGDGPLPPLSICAATLTLPPLILFIHI